MKSEQDILQESKDYLWDKLADKEKEFIVKYISSSKLIPFGDGGVIYPDVSINVGSIVEYRK